jgi:hypothetical protein
VRGAGGKEGVGMNVRGGVGEGKGGGGVSSARYRPRISQSVSAVRLRVWISGDPLPLWCLSVDRSTRRPHSALCPRP